MNHSEQSVKNRVETISHSARFVLICLNPKAGRGSSGALAQALQDILQTRGFQAEVQTDIQRIREISTQQQATGNLRAVVGVGGDGTQSLLLNTIPRDANLCIFPQGTENVLGKYLGLKATPEFIADLLEQGRVISMDTGQVTDESGKQYLFCLMAGCGFDAEVVERLASRRSGHITKFSYVIPTLAAVWKYRFPRLHIKVLDDDARSFKATFLFFMNIKRYALGIRIAPDASPVDGELDACGFLKPGIFHGLKYFWKLCRATHTRSAEYMMQRAVSFHVRAATQRRVPVQIDGDPCTELPITVTTLAGRMRLLVPQTFIEQLAVDNAEPIKAKASLP